MKGEPIAATFETALYDGPAGVCELHSRWVLPYDCPGCGPGRNRRERERAEATSIVERTAEAVVGDAMAEVARVEARMKGKWRRMSIGQTVALPEKPR